MRRLDVTVSPAGSATSTSRSRRTTSTASTSTSTTGRGRRSTLRPASLTRRAYPVPRASRSRLRRRRARGRAKGRHRVADVSPAETPRLDRLQAALAAADLDAVRGILLELDGEEQRLLEQGMGSEAFERSRRAAARGRRRGKLGKVLVLPGIMGSELDSVDRSGEAERIWLNFIKLILGRIADFELTPEGEPAKAGINPPGGSAPRDLRADPHGARLAGTSGRSPSTGGGHRPQRGRLEAEIKAFGAGDPVPRHPLDGRPGGASLSTASVRRGRRWTIPRDAAGRPADHDGDPEPRLVRDPARADRRGEGRPGTRHRGHRALARGDPRRSSPPSRACTRCCPRRSWTSTATITRSSSSVRPGAVSQYTSRCSIVRAFYADLEEVVDPDRLLYIAGYDRRTPFLLELRPREVHVRRDTRG